MLPEEIGSCSSLKTLNVNENVLLALPDGLSNLGRLEMISAVGNGLVYLPRDWSGLIALEAAWLAQVSVSSSSMRSLLVGVPWWRSLSACVPLVSVKMRTLVAPPPPFGVLDVNGYSST